MKLTNTPIDECNARGVFTNAHGTITVGTRVTFKVENQDQWHGDLEGVLIYEDGAFRVRTDRSGTLTINRGWDVYYNSIQPQ